MWFDGLKNPAYNLSNRDLKRGSTGLRIQLLIIHELRGGSWWGIQPLENFWLINDTLPKKLHLI